MRYSSTAVEFPTAPKHYYPHARTRATNVKNMNDSTYFYKTNLKRLNVLILCEESQAETTAFRDIGQRAFSCDLQPSSIHPEWHITGDARQFFEPLPHTFTTQDGKRHCVSHWDLVIAHPPCTYLCRLSICRLKVHGKMNWERLRGMILGRRFFFGMSQ